MADIPTGMFLWANETLTSVLLLMGIELECFGVFMPRRQWANPGGNNVNNKYIWRHTCMQCLNSRLSSINCGAGGGLPWGYIEGFIRITARCRETLTAAASAGPRCSTRVYWGYTAFSAGTLATAVEEGSLCTSRALKKPQKDSPFSSGDSNQRAGAVVEFLNFSGFNLICHTRACF